jgi:hypothetical protein
MLWPIGVDGVNEGMVFTAWLAADTTAEVTVNISFFFFDNH